MNKDLIIMNKEMIELISYEARVRMLQQIDKHQGLCKVELLKELDKHFNHDMLNLKWLIDHDFVQIVKQVTRKAKGRKRHHLFLTEKGREVLVLLNNI